MIFADGKENWEDALFENLLALDAPTELLIAIDYYFRSYFFLFLDAWKHFWVDALVLTGLNVEVAEELSDGLLFVHFETFYGLFALD